MRFSPTGYIRKRAQAWARRRQGMDGSPVALEKRRVYILPTRAGIVFGSMLFAMLLGSMNYSNSMGFVLTFFLGGLALVSMHHCHRNLEGLVLRLGKVEPVFAGQQTTFLLFTENRARTHRFGITIHYKGKPFSRTDIPADGSALMSFTAATTSRGLFRPGRFGVSTTYPFGLYRAWAWMHMDMACLVYPKPAEQVPELPPAPADSGGLLLDESGQDDFSGLRDYRLGDAPRHIAWKASARLAEGFLVKQFHGGGTVQRVFDFDQLVHVETELRLAILCRWIIDADRNVENYALHLPGEQIGSGQGGEHRKKCLEALALFGSTPAQTRMAA
ncbi:MAG: DUF58 domain-containing protein [Gammaproteobacteria bacterium]